MKNRKDLFELPLRVFVSVPEFEEFHFPKDFEQLLRIMAASDSDYIVRFSENGIEIVYESDEWFLFK